MRERKTEDHMSFFFILVKVFCTAGLLPKIFRRTNREMIATAKTQTATVTMPCSSTNCWIVWTCVFMN